MAAGDESPLEAAERRARESRQHSDEVEGQQAAEASASRRAASESATRLVSGCLDRLAEAGWPAGELVSVRDVVSEPTGLLRRPKERLTWLDREVWKAPVGVGYKADTLVGSTVDGEWVKFYRDSQIAIDHEGQLWHGAYSSEKDRRSWNKLGLPSNEAQVEALTEALGAILAEHIPAR